MEKNIVQHAMTAFDRAKEFGMKEPMWLAFKQAYIKSFQRGQESITEVYEARYCSCVHESTFATISIHRTLRGAEMAMEYHKEAERKEFEATYKDIDPPMPFGAFEEWDVIKTKLEE